MFPTSLILIGRSRHAISLIRGQMSEDRGQMSEARCQRAEDRCQRSEVRGRKTEVRGQRSDDRIQITAAGNQITLIIHFHNPFDPPAPSTERCLTLCAMPFALCPFCPQPVTRNSQPITRNGSTQVSERRTYEYCA